MGRGFFIACLLSWQLRCIDGIGCPVYPLAGGSSPNMLYNCGQNGLIALTFDDGTTDDTAALSAKLYAAGIKATFFINGDTAPLAARSWGVVGTLYEHGHQVSSHTRSHCNMIGGPGGGVPCDSLEGGWQADLEDLVADVRNNGQEIRGTANQGGWYWFRPPYLDVDPATAEELGVAGYQVSWVTDNGNDWTGDNEPTKECLLDIVNHSSAGSSHVMLQHCWAAEYDISADWWLDLKARADANGWEFVTIDECAVGASLPTPAPSPTQVPTPPAPTPNPVPTPSTPGPSPAPKPIGCPMYPCGGGSCPNTLFNCGQNGLIALTFDDGLTDGTAVLSANLHAAGIKASFFINGDGAPGAARTWGVMSTLYEHGHQVSSHTKTHCNLGSGAGGGEPCDTYAGGWKANLDDLVADVRNNGQEIRGTANQGEWYWLRPPYVDIDPATAEDVGVAGYRVAWATDSANDWTGDNEPTKECLLDIVNHSSAGSSHVMLQHDWAAGWGISADWWLDLKAKADANGWQFVTIDECAAGMSTPAPTSTSAPTPAPTSAPPAPPTAQPTPAPAPGSCRQQLDCDLSIYCNNSAYAQYCIQNGAAGYCPEPMCTTTPAGSLLETDLLAAQAARGEAMVGMKAKVSAVQEAQSEAMAGMKAKAQAAGRLRRQEV